MNVGPLIVYERQGNRMRRWQVASARWPYDMCVRRDRRHTHCDTCVRAYRRDRRHTHCDIDVIDVIHTVHLQVHVQTDIGLCLSGCVLAGVYGYHVCVSCMDIMHMDI